MSDSYIYEQANRLAWEEIGGRKKKIKPQPIVVPPRSIAEVSEERIKERMMEIGAPKWGYPELDTLIKGPLPGHTYVVTGNENVGKTSLACNFAVRVANQGKKVLYFALEPENTVVDYIASVRTDKKFDDLSIEDLKVDDGNIKVYGKEQVPDIDTMVAIVKHSEHYDLIIIDHIGYFIGSTQNTNQEQSNAMKSLAGLAKANKVAIVIIAHLRKRSANQKKDYTPTSDDISGSGAFKQDATEVMIVVRQLQDATAGGLEYTSEGVLFVTKTKCGPNGSMVLWFSDRKANITSPGELNEKNGWRKVKFTPSEAASENWWDEVDTSPEE